MKYLLILILSFTLSSFTKAQFVKVSDTSIVYLQLKNYYLRGIKDTVSYRMPLIYHENILDSTQTMFGIFIYRPLTSTNLQELYLRNFNSDTIEIIEQYNLEKVFIKVFNYFKINSASISYSQKLECARKIVEMLQQRSR